MLDIKFIRENVDAVLRAAKVKNIKLDLDKLLEVDAKIVSMKTELQSYNEQVNALSRDVVNANVDEKKSIIEQSKKIGTDAKKIEADLNILQNEFDVLMRTIPQVPDADVPVGADDSENVVIKTVGEPTKFSFAPRSQIELIEMNNWADFERTASISGARTLSLKGDLARLEIALHLYALDKLSDLGFKQISTPSICPADAVFAAGHYPGTDESIMESDVYKMEKDNLCLAGTSEIIINSLHKNEILNEADLPILYAGYSPCFRREAGAAGKDTQGLIRVHQFMKVEEFVICKNDIDESKKWHAILQKTMEDLCADMNIPYHVLEACTGDMGFNKIRMVDIEAWVPSQEKYREVGSDSMIGEFQSRRTNLRYRETATGKVKFCHTLNNTGIATPRFLVPFMENNQNADGSVNIPNALQPYMKNLKKIGGKTS
ncbi:MAG: serine--tRNA ligase [Rickettsiales bacterium]|jgi:seryl-tRNA synthetase|nr:serine--tRNA ligase [Rickettsiales bacterium]